VVVAIIVGLGLAAGAAAVFGDKDTAQPFGTSKEGDPVADLGPVKGAALNDYIKKRQEALAEASGKHLAVVSLGRYTTEAEARTTAGSAGIVGLLAAPQGGAPSLVTGDLRGWADEQKAAARAERDGFEGQLKDTDDPESRAQFQAEIKRLNGLIEHVTPSGLVVFGVVVNVDAAKLRDVAKAPGVRLVDVGTSDQAASGVQYRGIRPEETTQAGEPEFRPL
jgi:hypothetical protein